MSERLAVLRMHGAGDQGAMTPGDSHGHHRRLGDRRRGIVHGRIGHVHARKLADHALEFEDRGQRALRDFRLIRRVGGKKFAARNDGIDHHGAVVVIHTRAQKISITVGIFRATALEIIQDFVFAFSRRDGKGIVEPHGRGQVRRQVFHARKADGFEHLATLRV